MTWKTGVRKQENLFKAEASARWAGQRVVRTAETAAGVDSGGPAEPSGPGVSIDQAAA